jgi:hypothetical protein
VRWRISIFFIIVLLAVTTAFADSLKYLIITHNNFYQAIQPLAQWKYKKGIITKIITVPDGLSSTMIRDTIRQYQPEYVLLVGDRRFIPLGKYFPDWVQSYPFLGTWTDQYYADTTDDAEYKDDIKLGRLPCSTAVQCSVMINKIITYERKPSVNNDWFIKATGAARDIENNTYWDSCYRATIKEIRNILLKGGFNYVDTFFATNGANRDSVERVVTDGRGYVVYRGIALNSTDNWRSPFNVNPEAINNDSMPTIVVSTTCRTMFFPDTFELPTAGGHRWLESGSVDIPKGGAAFWGTTTHYYAGFDTIQVFWRNAAAVKFFQAITQESVYVLGEVIQKAKDSLFACCSTYTVGQTNWAGACSVAYMEWNLLGDPELNLWTKIPQALTVVHDTMIKPQPTNYQVLVSSNDVPVQHALVCVMMDSTIYKVGYTDSIGLIIFSFTPRHPGTLQVTVTRPNYIPYEGSTKVVVRDVGVTRIIAPAGILDSTSSIIPQVLVKNYGSNTETFDVTLKIDTSYTCTRTKKLDAGIEDTVNFPDWIPVRGTHIACCSTYVVDDTNPTNDTITDSVLVMVKDVGIIRVIVPTGTIDSGAVVIPQVKGMNYGTNSASFPVWFIIDSTSSQLATINEAKLNFSLASINSDHLAYLNNLKTEPITVSDKPTSELRFDQIYEDSVWISLEPGDSALCSFQPWTTTIPDTYRLESYTMLNEDMNPNNDSAFDSVTVGSPIHDAGILSILSPTGAIDSGTVVIPKALARNFGTVQENFVARFKIGNFYVDTIIITLETGAIDTVEFTAWNALQVGSHIVKCTTLLASDTNHGNDMVIDTIRVQPMVGISEPSYVQTLPKLFALENNLPNPFSSKTILRYALPKECAVKLKIYNTSGAIIRTLNAGIEKPGFYRVIWNGCDDKGKEVAKGVYFYLIQANEFKATRKTIKLD